MKEKKVGGKRQMMFERVREHKSSFSSKVYSPSVKSCPPVLSSCPPASPGGVRLIRIAAQYVYTAHSLYRLSCSCCAAPQIPFLFSFELPPRQREM